MAGNSEAQKSKEKLLCTKTNIREILEYQNKSEKNWSLAVEILHEKTTNSFREYS